LFYILTQKLNDESIPWIALNDLNEVPDWKNTLLITTQADVDKFKPHFFHTEILQLSRNQSVEEIFLTVLKSLNQIQDVKSVMIAIDPGIEQTGVALFINEKFLISEIFFRNAPLMERIKLY